MNGPLSPVGDLSRVLPVTLYGLSRALGRRPLLPSFVRRCVIAANLMAKSGKQASSADPVRLPGPSHRLSKGGLRTPVPVHCGSASRPRGCPCGYSVAAGLNAGSATCQPCVLSQVLRRRALASSWGCDTPEETEGGRDSAPARHVPCPTGDPCHSWWEGSHGSKPQKTSSHTEDGEAWWWRDRGHQPRRHHRGP